MIEEIEEIKKLKESLGKTLRIKMDDGRVIQGEFQCMDKDLNFIIGGATEYHGMTNLAASPEEANIIPQRHLGMVMVPGKHILSVLVEGK